MAEKKKKQVLGDIRVTPTLDPLQVEALPGMRSCPKCGSKEIVDSILWVKDPNYKGEPDLILEARRKERYDLKEAVLNTLAEQIADRGMLQMMSDTFMERLQYMEEEDKKLPPPPEDPKKGHYTPCHCEKCGWEGRRTDLTGEDAQFSPFELCVFDPWFEECTNKPVVGGVRFSEHSDHKDLWEVDCPSCGASPARWVPVRWDPQAGQHPFCCSVCGRLERVIDKKLDDPVVDITYAAKLQAGEYDILKVGTIPM